MVKPGPAVRKDTQDRSFWRREKRTRIVTLFRVGIVLSFGCAGGTTKSGLKLIQECELERFLKMIFFKYIIQNLHSKLYIVIIYSEQKSKLTEVD